MNVEDDEAGRLAAFRAKFGRSYDAASAPADETSPDEKKDAEAEAKAAQAEEDNLLDLISSFGKRQPPPPPEKKTPYKK